MKPTAHSQFLLALPKWSSVVKLWYTGPDRWRAWSFTAASIVLSLSNTALVVKVSYCQRNFSTALSERKVADFYLAVWQFAGVVCVAAPLFALTDFVQMRLNLAWRSHLTDLLVHCFFKQRAYYRISHLDNIDNPDQRLCQDIESFVANSTNVLNIVVTKVFNCVAFAGVLWSVSPFLVAILFTYALVGTGITTTVFGRQLMRLQFQVLKQEGDLRFALVRVRENSEAIAFYRGEVTEAACVMRRFRDALATHVVHIKWASYLAIWRNVYSYATILVPSTVTAPRYFRGEIQFGVVTQAGFAFGRIEAALSIIVSSLEKLSGLAAETERLHELICALHNSGVDLQNHAVTSHAQSKKDDGAIRDAAASTSSATSPLWRWLNVTRPVHSGKESAALLPPKSSGPQVARIDLTEPTSAGSRDGVVQPVGVVLRVSNLTVHTPAAGTHGLSRGCCVADDLSFALAEGQSLLIVGPSGCGKSSLLRVMSGLWAEGTGSVACIPIEAVMFLPQKPYMPLGTLRQQLLFPGERGEMSDGALSELARDVSLPGVADAAADLDKEDNWGEIFSLGEQQRIAFFRLLRCKPTLAFLDEATSALDVGTEGILYSRLQAACRSYVSVGHRPKLLDYHSHVLKWVQPGKWLLMLAADYVPAADHFGNAK